MSPELKPEHVMIGEYEVPIGQLVFVKEHSGCAGGDGKISKIYGNGDFDISCNNCGKKVLLEPEPTIEYLKKTLDGNKTASG